MTIWEKLKSWLTDEQYSEIEGSKDELQEPTVEVKDETDTEGSKTTQDEPKEEKEETTPIETKTETEPVVEEDKPVSEVEVKDEVSESDGESQASPVILEDGWITDSGEVDLEKVKDDQLKTYIEGLIKKSTVAEQTEHGFNPTAPSSSPGYVEDMSFEDALSLEYKN